MLYGNNGTIQYSREEAVKKYLPLVKKIANSLNKKMHYLAELDDLVQCGLIGLLDALDKYKNDRNAQFETYASTRIYGAMVDELRKMDTLSQDDRSELKKIDKATKELEAINNTAPTDLEIAKQCNVSIEQYYKLLQLRITSSVLSSDSSPEMSAYVSEVSSLDATPEESLQNSQFKSSLVGAIDNLPEREKMIMSLYYQEEFTFKEIAGLLDLTEARISQLHTQAINRLRTKLT
jgi:RNA polymerase sigma factor for flagellar operon FliA